MKLAIMQPYFMPYIGYFQAINAVDKYILYSNVSFVKKAWMNRNRIMLKNREIQTITVPLKHKSSNMQISDILIDNSKQWNKCLLKTIAMNYKKSVFFDQVFPLLENMLSVTYEKLMDLNNETIRAIVRFLDVDTEIDTDNTRFLDMEKTLESIESDYSKLPYLEATRPKKKVARILEMCRMEGCNHYVNAIGGRELYDKQEFEKYGVKLDFIKTNAFSYSQFSNEFEPNLSIIDVMMHNGKEGTKKLLNEYTLV